ncbi:hypothetical protein M433DRAFT_176388 [Acidomyces richmondensis BFW]|nr:MAG: hypothetical protein FE78DRAFT_523810 [Acidomyces sp. 'richmondensis']KYG42882.1 hypothetical protein M433DRAFT_176388 [Acidomyces richmondensis BFW]
MRTNPPPRPRHAFRSVDSSSTSHGAPDGGMANLGSRHFSSRPLFCWRCSWHHPPPSPASPTEEMQDHPPSAPIGPRNPTPPYLAQPVQVYVTGPLEQRFDRSSVRRGLAYPIFPIFCQWVLGNAYEFSATSGIPASGVRHRPCVFDTPVVPKAVARERLREGSRRPRRCVAANRTLVCTWYIEAYGTKLSSPTAKAGGLAKRWSPRARPLSHPIIHNGRHLFACSHTRQRTITSHARQGIV